MDLTPDPAKAPGRGSGCRRESRVPSPSPPLGMATRPPNKVSWSPVLQSKRMREMRSREGPW